MREERERRREGVALKSVGCMCVSLTNVDSGGFYDGVSEAVNISVISGAGIAVGFVDLTVSLGCRLVSDIVLLAFLMQM